MAQFLRAHLEDVAFLTRRPLNRGPSSKEWGVHSVGTMLRSLARIRIVALRPRIIAPGHCAAHRGTYFAIVMQLSRFMLVVAALMLGSVPASGAPVGTARAARGRIDGALATKGLSFGSPLYVRIFKEEAELEVWLQSGSRYELFKTYPVCARSGTLGPKEREGDAQSPEGFYSVTRPKLNPASHYHLAFDIGYPNAYDRSLGRTGSLIMVHGSCVSIGCFAMTDEGIEEIYSLADAALAKGQASFAVHVFPFRMTDEHTKKHTDSAWAPFWSELKVGYDAFEATHVPPNVGVDAGRYVLR